MAYENYPSNWRKITLTIRRIAGWRCEKCGKRAHSVHHIGAPYADGRPGDPKDKHDIRRENLMSVCKKCHASLDGYEPNPKSAAKNKRRNQRKKQRKMAQRLLCMPRIEVNA